MKITVTQTVRVTSAAGDVVLEAGTHESSSPLEEAAFALLLSQGFATLAASTETPAAATPRKKA